MAPLLHSPGKGIAKLFARTPATPTFKSLPVLVQRQDAPTATVTLVADDNGGTILSGGAIAGIVIGSIAGFLLLLWIFRSCLNLGAPPQEGGTEKWYRDDPRRHRRYRHRTHSRRGSSSMSIPPAVIIRDSRSRSRHSHSSPSYAYSESDRGRRSHHSRH